MYQFFDKHLTDLTFVCFFIYLGIASILDKFFDHRENMKALEKGINVYQDEEDEKGASVLDDSQKGR